jgi:hypothetical protein
VGRVWRACDAEIEGEIRQAWGVAVAIGSIGLAACGGNLLAARRLRVLPCRYVWRSTGGERWRLHGATGSGRAGVLIDPECDLMKMLRGDLLANVLDGGDGLAGGVVDGLSAGVDAGKIAGVCDCFGPRQKIRRLICVKTAAFLLIEKDDGVGGEVLPLRGGDGSCGILCSKRSGCRASPFRLCNFGVGLAVGQYEEAEAAVEQSVALALPTVSVRAGRVREPVSGEGEVASQCRKGGITGIVVAVEADGILCRRTLLCTGDCGEKKKSRKECRKSSHREGSKSASN